MDFANLYPSARLIAVEMDGDNSRYFRRPGRLLGLRDIWAESAGSAGARSASYSSSQSNAF